MNFARMTKGESGSRLENISGDIRMKKRSVFILKGNIVYSKNRKSFQSVKTDMWFVRTVLSKAYIKHFRLNSGEIRSGIMEMH